MVWTEELSILFKKKLKNKEMSINQATKELGLNYRTIKKLLDSPGITVYKRVYEITVYWLLGIEYKEEVA